MQAVDADHPRGLLCITHDDALPVETLEAAAADLRDLEVPRGNGASAERTAPIAVDHVPLDDAPEAVDAWLEAHRPLAVLHRIASADDAGLEVLSTLRDRHGNLPVVVLLDAEDTETALAAFQRGADERLSTADVSPSMLESTIRRAVERRRDRLECHRYESLFEGATDAIAVLAPDGTVRDVTPSVDRVLGHEPAELEGEDAFDLLHPADHDAVGRELDRLLANPDYRASAELQVQRADGEWTVLEARARNLLDNPAVGGLAVYTHDVTERVEYERRLETRERALQEVASIMADYSLDFEGTIQAVLDACRAYLDVEYGVLSRIVDDEYVYQAVSATDDAIRAGDTRPLSATTCARTVSRKRRLVIEDLTASAPELANRAGNSELDAASYLGTPVFVDGDVVGTYCFLGTAPRDGFAAWERSLVDLLAEWIGSELERRRSTERLAVLHTLNESVRDVTTAVIDGSTRGEIERTACERLAATDGWAFAAIGEVESGGDRVRPRTEVGVDGFLETAEITVDPSDVHGRGPTARALRTGEPVVVRDVTTDATYAPWQTMATDYGYGAVAATPIAHEDSTYGVLVVAAERAGAFDDSTRRAVGHLGDVLGHAIAAVERKRALLSDAVVELDLEIPDVVADLDVVDSVDGPVRVDGVLPLDDAEFLVYGSMPAGLADRAPAWADAIDDWQVLTVGAVTDDVARFELQLADAPLLATIASRDGDVQQARLEDGDYRMTVQFPGGTDVRALVNDLRDHNQEITVLARRQVVRSEPPARRLGEAWGERLTDRQRTVVEAAYRAGFFEWPRRQSGETVAESLDISPPTFHEHLRGAEAELFETILEETPRPDPS